MGQTASQDRDETASAGAPQDSAVPISGRGTVSERLDRRLQWSRVCALIVSGFGAAGLLGWILEIPAAVPVGWGPVPMAPSTAVAFVLNAVAILLVARRAPVRAFSVAAATMHGVLALAAVVLLFLSAQGIHLDLEHPMFGLVHRPGEPPLGHMSPVTAALLLAASLSFLALLSASPERPWRRAAAWWIGAALSAAGLVLVLSLAYGMPNMSGDSFIPPAPTSALAFAALGAALAGLAGHGFARPGRPAAAPQHKTAVLLASVFAALAIGIIGAGWLYSRQLNRQIRAAVEDQLTSVAELKVADLVQWRKERLGDASILHRNPEFAALAARVFRDPQDADARSRVLASLAGFQEAFGYERVTLVDLNGGARLWVPDSPGPPNHDGEQVRRAALAGRVGMLDLHRDLTDRQLYLSIVAPLLGGRDGREPLGAVVLRVDPSRYLYPLITRWPVPSDTAETLLVRREGDNVVFLNELRFRKETALNLRAPMVDLQMPAVMAARGLEGIVEGVDYRGVPVLACLRTVPDSPWALVARMDLVEVYAPLAGRIWTLVGVVVLLVVAAGAMVGLLWSWQTAGFYRERSEAEEALRASEHRFRALVDGAAEYAIYMLDPGGLVVSWNPGAERMKGYGSGEIIGRHFSAFFPADELAAARPQRLLEEAASNGRAVDEGWRLRKDGSRFWADAVMSPLRRPDGSLQGYAGITRDLTERKRADDTLRHVTSLLRAVRNVNQLITQEKDRDTLLRRACEILTEARGYRSAWVAATDPSGALSYATESGIGSGFVEIRAQIEEGRWPSCCEEAFGRPDVVVKHDTVADRQDSGLSSTSRETATMAAALTHEGRTLGVIVVALPSAVADDPEEQSLFAELAGDLSFALHAMKVEKERRGAAEAAEYHQALLEETGRMARVGGWEFDAATGEGTWTDEVARIHGLDPGVRTEVRLGLSYYRDDSRARIETAVRAAIELAQPYDLELELTTAAGHRKWVRTIGHPIIEDGNVIKVRGSFQDISDLKRAEDALGRLNEELEQRVLSRTAELEDANRELEAFSYSVSHDLRAPLRGIDGWSLALLEDFPDCLDDRAQQYLDRIRAEAQRMGLLIDNLLELSRVGRAEMRTAVVDLSDLAGRVCGRQQAENPARRVECVIEPGLITRGDPVLLEVALANLIENAWKFTAPREPARIEVGHVSSDGPQVFFVRDNGVGFDLRHATKLFGAFQRLHGVSEFPGTGIGLATVQRIVRRHGGRIWAEAEVDHGATFSFTLMEHHQ